MTTWKLFDVSGGSGASGSTATRWEYDNATGRLLRKIYNDDHATSYTYTLAGKLKTRTWARGITTTYSYNPAGDLTKVDYSDATADIEYAHDRRGRKVRVVGGGAHRLSYSEDGRLKAEEITFWSSADELDKKVIDYGYDSTGRRVARAARFHPAGDADHDTEVTTSDLASVLSAMDSMQGDPNWDPAADFDGDGEITTSDLATVLLNMDRTGWKAPMTVYAYDYASRLSAVSERDAWDNHTLHTVTYSYQDNSNLLASAVFDNTTANVLSTTKAYDKFNRLLSVTNDPLVGDNLTYSYDYNIANQRTTQWVQGTPWEYTYDALGQLNFAEKNNGPRYEYAYDHIGNRISTDIVGLVPDNGTTDYVSNLLNQYASRTNDNITDNFTYDADGNLTQDATWTYAWDGENRLKAMETRETRGDNKPVRKLNFVYDYMGRRVMKSVLDLNEDNTTYTTSLFRQFVYDGWNLIAETNENTELVRTYSWGQDLGGSLEGAGGIGGLVFEMDSATGVTYFPAYDGNGNLTGLYRSDNATREAYYEYSPYGQVISSTGSYADENPFKFSTKYYDSETGLHYFGYRYYNPKTGRWISRDRKGEKGGINIYGFVCNEPISGFDALGLYAIGFPSVNPWGPPNPFFPPGFPGGPFGPVCCPTLPPTTLTPQKAAWDAQYKYFGNISDPYNGGYRHCVAACHLARLLGPLGGFVAVCVRDYWADEKDEGDLKAEQIGLDVAMRSSTCEEGCLTPYPPPPNYDPNNAPFPFMPNVPVFPPIF